MKVHLFVPCLVNQFTPQAAGASLTLLRAAGHEVIIPTNQTCCGQPAFNSGYWDEARRVAVQFKRIFQDAEVIVGPSGSCISMLKNHYAELGLEFDENIRIFEIVEFLYHYGPTLKFRPNPKKVVLHEACHALRELRLGKEPREMLARIPDLKVIELDDNQACCGFGGIFSVKLPELSLDMARQKVRTLQATGITEVVSLDSGCMMNLQSTAEGLGIELKARHVVELLGESLLSSPVTVP